MSDYSQSYTATARLLAWSSNKNGHVGRFLLDAPLGEAHPLCAERVGLDNGQLYRITLEPIEEGTQ
jgi:hypothetical protein